MLENILTGLALTTAYAALIYLIARCMGLASDVDYDEEEQ